MVRNKQELIDYIKRTPFEEIEKELKECGMETYKNTPNVINRSVESDEYRSTGKCDDNWVEILEGSIIRADGYGSNIEERRFYCVEYDEDEATFGSCIYGDFEPLGRYTTIKVLGHCEDFRELYESDDWDGSGNLGAVLK